MKRLSPTGARQPLSAEPPADHTTPQETEDTASQDRRRRWSAQGGDFGSAPPARTRGEEQPHSPELPFWQADGVLAQRLERPFKSQLPPSKRIRFDLSQNI